jgi:hypothetical protein
VTPDARAIRGYNKSVQPLLERLNQVGFEGPRRAFATLALSLFVFFYLMIALLLFLNGQQAWLPPFVALSACYSVAFMGVAAEWFWGRWFATGLGWSGVMIAILPFVMGGQVGPVLVAFGALHGLIILMLAGRKMAERYEAQPAWRERYGMDEFGVDRLRKTVTRASASLPSVILWALAPKEPGQAVFAAMTLTSGALVVAGLVGVVRVRAWGLLALAGAAAALVIGGGAAYPHFNFAGLATSALSGAGTSFHDWGTIWAYRGVVAGPALPILVLAAAVAPFVGLTARFLRAGQ